MSYRPKTIKTSHVKLPKWLAGLKERLAENAHDHWANLRIGEGWSYGEQRDDSRKETPCLVPYAKLPESEKEYDRKTAMETLKAILALGYSIQEPDPALRPSVARMTGRRRSTKKRPAPGRTKAT